MARSARQVLPLLVALLLGSCSKSPTSPTPMPVAPGPPVLACPMPQQVSSSSGAPTPVVYGSATVTGGAQPVVISCSPPSQSVFPVGATPVTCTAVDQQQRAASCQFTVTVTASEMSVPRLSVTTFEAFGDSITEGEDGTASMSLHTLILRPDLAYPTVLQEKLQARYTAQHPTVNNDGVGGERASSKDALERFTQAINSGRYGAVLLLDGANDLFTRDPDAIPPAIQGMENMLQVALQMHVRPYLATLPPEDPNGRRGGGAFLVGPFNDAVASLANKYAPVVTLVDVNKAFASTDYRSLLSTDGLHPNPAGWQVIADTFLQAIEATLETPAATSSVPGPVRGLVIEAR